MLPPMRGTSLGQHEASAFASPTDADSGASGGAPSPLYRYALLLDTVRFHAKRTLPGDRPFINVNLIQLHRGRPQTSSSHHTSDPRIDALALLQGYWKQLFDLIASQGGSTLFVGAVTKIIDAHDGTSGPTILPWDVIAYVWYPSLEHYCRVIDARGPFPGIKSTRRAAVRHSVLYASEAADCAPLRCPATSMPSFTQQDGNAMARHHGQFIEGVLDISNVATGAVPVGARPVDHLTGAAMLVGDAGHLIWRHFSLAPGGFSSARPLPATTSAAAGGGTVRFQFLATLSQVTDLSAAMGLFHRVATSTTTSGGSFDTAAKL